MLNHMSNLFLYTVSEFIHGLICLHIPLLNELAVCVNEVAVCVSIMGGISFYIGSTCQAINEEKKSVSSERVIHTTA